MQQSGSSSISTQSTASKIAVQLEHYLRSFVPDLIPSSSVTAEDAVASLCQWTVFNVEVWQSHPSRASSSCADHIYLILEATHELEGPLRLQINSTHCSGHFDTDEIDKALLGLQLTRNPEPRLLDSFHPSQCPPSSPMSYTSLITVTPIAQGARTVDECIRRVSFDLDVDSVYQADSSECTNGEQEITLLSIALLITTSLRDIDLEEEKGSLCQNIVRGITEGAMKTGQPFVENSSGSSDGSARCVHSISSQSSYERTSSEIDAECLLRRRKILELKLRLAVAELASVYTDLKLFILRNAPLTVGMDESDGQWDDQILDLLQAAGAPL